MPNRSEAFIIMIQSSVIVVRRFIFPEAGVPQDGFDIVPHFRTRQIRSNEIQMRSNELFDVASFQGSLPTPTNHY